MKDELSNYIFRKEAENIIEKCKEINNSIEIEKEEGKENTSDNKDTKNPKEEKEKRDKEALSYIRERVCNLLDYAEDDILVFKEDSYNDMNDEDFLEAFCYIEKILKNLTKALVLGNKKDKYYDDYFNKFCLCLYERCKLEFTRRYNNQGHMYRISDLLLMASDTIKK